MLGWTQKLGYGVLIITLLISVLAAVPAAAATACSGDVSIHTTSPVWSDDYTITITNTGSNGIQWIDISVPSSNFTYTGNSISNWDTADHGNGTTLTGNTLAPGDTTSFSISAATDIATAAPADWQVKVTPGEAPGLNPVSCNGDFSTAITGHPPNNSMNGVEDIMATNVTSNSTTIIWDTDVPTSSLVYYGRTSNYGQTSAYDTNQVTNHSVTLSGLSSASGYHFQVAGSDGQGNFAYSADNTFLTAALVHTQPATINSLVPSAPFGISETQANDKVPPHITMSTQLSGVYTSVPTFSGTATDDKGVAAVEYSTDGGRNWLPVDDLQTPGQTRVSFSFTPTLPQDGNYPILVRAVDVGGNTALAGQQTLILDRLPPLVGGNILSVGPQIIQPSANGTLKVLAGVDQKITLSAVGGPTSIVIEATTNVPSKTGSKAYTQNFSLTFDEDSGLWSGVATFLRPGTYTLSAHAIDGAGNKTVRQLNTVQVAALARVVDAHSGKAIQATVTAYYLEPDTNHWVTWDAAAFGQHNPQSTTASGEFSLFLPPGTYYLKATAPSYRTVISSIITTRQSLPVTTTLTMHAAGGIRIGSYSWHLPTLSTEHIQLAAANSSTVSSPLVGKPAPDFTLTDTNGNVVHTADLLGRPTILTLASTWAPTTAQQLNSLSQLQTNSDINVIPVALQENTSQVEAYTSIAHVQLRWLVDPNSTMSGPYQVQTVPMHYFIDRKGIVRQVVVGVLSKQQLLTMVSGL